MVLPSRTAIGLLALALLWPADAGCADRPTKDKRARLAPAAQAAVLPPQVRLQTHLPEAPIEEPREAAEDGAAHWHALYLDAKGLRLEPVRRLEARLAPFDWLHPYDEKRYQVAAVEGDPLMLLRMVHVESDRSLALPAGIADGQKADELIREGWKRTVSLGGTVWTFSADYVKGPTGRVLPGSMQLRVASTADVSEGRVRVVLERAPGLVFTRQRVIWIGDLNRDRKPDVVVQRTLVTGEIDYVVCMSDPVYPTYAVAGITVDPDGAEMGFSSGVGMLEEAEDLSLNSPPQFPLYRFPSKTAKAPVWAKSGAVPLKDHPLYDNAPLQEASTSGIVPQRIFQTPQPPAGVVRDLSFDFGDERYRLTVEAVPVYQAEAHGPGYESQLGFGAYANGGPGVLLVTLWHKGSRQVLLATQTLMDDGTMRLSAGDFDASGKLSLRIEYPPHYNNHMTYEWRGAEGGGRLMKRVSVFQAQGC